MYPNVALPNTSLRSSAVLLSRGQPCTAATVINHYADRDAIIDSARRTNLEPLQVYIAGSGWEVLKSLVTAYWRPSMDSL